MSNRTLPALSDMAFQFFSQLDDQLRSSLTPERYEVAVAILGNLAFQVGDLQAENDSLRRELAATHGLLNAFEIMHMDDTGEAFFEGVAVQMDHTSEQIQQMTGCSVEAANELVLWMDTMADDPSALSERGREVLITLTEMALDRAELMEGE